MRPETAGRARWSAAARRLGLAGAGTTLVVGVLYLAVIGAWLVVEGTPREPIGDPWLAGMEGLTVVSALALVGLTVALGRFAREDEEVWARVAGALAVAGAAVTLTVHFVQLTAVRQLWSAGRLAEYRLVWPSPLFAAEYLAWDVLFGLTMLAAASALGSGAREGAARRVLRLGGALCLLGVLGPLSGRMAIQNVAVLGYAVLLPLAAALLARLFVETPAAPRR